MHGIGEIDRSSAARQLDELALGREAEHLILVKLKLGVFEKLIRRGRVFKNFQQVLHPAKFLHGAGGRIILLI